MASRRGDQSCQTSRAPVIRVEDNPEHASSPAGNVIPAQLALGVQPHPPAVVGATSGLSYSLASLVARQQDQQMMLHQMQQTLMSLHTQQLNTLLSSTREGLSTRSQPTRGNTCVTEGLPRGEFRTTSGRRRDDTFEQAQIRRVIQRRDEPRAVEDSCPYVDNGSITSRDSEREIWCARCIRFHLGPDCSGDTVACHSSDYPGNNSFTRRTRPSRCKRCRRRHPGNDCKRGQLTCYTCGRPGHFAYECRNGGVQPLASHRGSERSAPTAREVPRPAAPSSMATVGSHRQPPLRIDDRPTTVLGTSAYAAPPTPPAAVGQTFAIGEAETSDSANVITDLL